MRIWSSLKVIFISTCFYLPVAHADYLNEQEFGQNGSIAKSLETNLNNYLMPFEVQQFGHSVYNAGTDYGALGNEITSSSPQMDFVTKHVQGYCSPNIKIEKDGFSCTGQTANLDNDAVSAQFLEMGDVRTSVLLEPNVYTPVVDLAARNFIRNITMPFPTQIYANYISNPSKFSSNVTQRKAYANYLASQALLGVARYAMDEMYGMRVAGSVIGSSGDAATRSILSVMENEASRRFIEPAYAAFLADTQNTDQTAMVRDLAAMQAFQLWMNYQSYKQNERIAALLAAILANSVGASINQANSAVASGVGN